ncbi:MAG: membrane protein insertase YidC [Oscillospiraceae bacterium]|nr:membrane protein insertase YidC [Oscillospiraceae bacterium]
MELFNTIFGWPLGWIMWFCYLVIRNYGLALIAFTIITKALLLPFAVKQQKSTIKMAVFKPKLDALQKMYGNNKEKLNEEMMKLYEKEGYNPMSGCLPMLIQFPILFGLIDVVYKPLTHILHLSNTEITAATDVAKSMMTNANTFTAQLQAVNFIQGGDPAMLEKFSALSAETIAKIQSVDFNFLGINLLQFPTLKMQDGQGFLPYFALLLIPILSGVTSLMLTLLQKHYNKATQPQQAGGMMNGMLYIMPLFSVYFAFLVPAAVGIYWLISNILMMVQAYFLNKKFNPEETARMVKEAEEAEKERQRKEKIEAKKKLAEKPSQADKAALTDEEKEELRKQALTEKELVAKRIAEARRRMEEKYGDAPSSDEKE